ncbi:MAG: uroporphyrinogen-III synthase [Acidimicrobiales bacterium]|jgi:uroporphyrinogen-III synthase
MTRLPLDGRSVVVTRTRSQASELADRLQGLGATVVELPVIAVEDPGDGGRELVRAVHRLASGAYQWVALTSSNAASRLLAELGDRTVSPSVRWAAVGAATARTLTDAGRSVDLVPEISMASALAEAFPTAAPGGPGPGGTVLYPRAETVSGSLAAGLRAKGWLVDEVVAYRTVAGDPGPEVVAAAGRADAVAFTSSSTVTRTLELLGPGGLPPLVVTIGPVTSETARSAGLTVAVEANPHTIEGLVEAVGATFDVVGR